MTKHPGGRPPHRPTPETNKQVETLASFGVPHIDIGKVIGINDRTLRKHYTSILDVAKTKANAMVAQSLFRKAISDGSQSVDAAKFWLRTQAGWKEARDSDDKDKAAAPPTIIVKFAQDGRAIVQDVDDEPSEH